MNITFDLNFLSPVENLGDYILSHILMGAASLYEPGPWELFFFFFPEKTII